MLLNLLAHRFQKLNIPHWLGTNISLGVGVSVLVAGIWLGIEEKKNWELTDNQRKDLVAALEVTTPKFPIAFYPLGRGTGLPPDKFATDLFRAFRASGWLETTLPKTNWVVPETTDLTITVCPGMAKQPPSAVFTLNWLLHTANIRSKPAVEENEDLKEAGCVIGIVVGHYPSLFERTKRWIEKTL